MGSQGPTTAGFESVAHELEELANTAAPQQGTGSALAQRLRTLAKRIRSNSDLATPPAATESHEPG
jgi:hypothetical protein